MLLSVRKQSPASADMQVSALMNVSMTGQVKIRPKQADPPPRHTAAVQKSQTTKCNYLCVPLSVCHNSVCPLTKVSHDLTTDNKIIIRLI